MVQKYSIARNDDMHLGWPDVALLPSGRLVAVWNECTSHVRRDRSTLVAAHSDDRGRTWSAPRPITPTLHEEKDGFFWNCPRLSVLSDGKLVMVADRVSQDKKGGQHGSAREQSNWLWQTSDGETWSGPEATPVIGIVPDRLLELKHGPHKGRRLITNHTRVRDGDQEVWVVRTWMSDDKGQTWNGPVTVASVPSLKLCEPSLMELPSGEIVAFLRENSMKGLDGFKTVSRDGGQTWSQPTEFPLSGLHRPTAGMLRSGQVLVTYRYCQWGAGWAGWWTQNLFGALTNVKSCLAPTRQQAQTRIFPIDYDRSKRADTGYSGWVQFPDGEIYVVNYIVDDAPHAQIRGYSFYEKDLTLP